MNPHSLVEQWLSSGEGAINDKLGWTQIDVTDLGEKPPMSNLFDWSMQLLLALIDYLGATDSQDTALLAVPLEYSVGMDLTIPTEEELASIEKLAEVPGLYVTRVLLDAWQPVERFRIPTGIGLPADSTILGFYSCWRSMSERSRGEEYARDLQYLWRAATNRA